MAFDENNNYGHPASISEDGMAQQGQAGRKETKKEKKKKRSYKKTI